ncbi:MAG: hypothetical protein AB7U20_15685 [Planctomycetaceae bacterium]
MPDELHKLFPLASTSFERYMLADDRPSHPMAAFMEIEVRGRISAEVLMRAFTPAVDRHPLLRATIRHNRWRVPCWHLADSRPPDVAAWGVPLACPEGERLDLTAGTGMRTWIRHAPDRTRITIQVHHACSDALGKLTFLADWLKLAVQIDTGDSTSPLPEPNWEAFRRRGQSPPVPRDVRRSARPPGILYDLYRFFYRPSVRLPGTGFDEAQDAVPLSGLYGVSVSDNVLQRIRHESRKEGVSVNDWLLAALFLSMADWTQKHHHEPPHKRFRVTIPFNMRTDENLYGPASNQIGYEILTHRPAAGADPMVLSREIARFTDAVRKLRNSTFAKILRASKVYSRFFPLIAHNWEKCFATVIFSNLGDVSQLLTPLVPERNGRWTIGNLVVERISCAPPTRPNTHLAMVVMRYGGRLHFTTRCEGRVLASRSIRGFLDHYRSTVLDLVGLEEADTLPSLDIPASTIADSA